ncbi:MAG: enoyl-CoA hydratase-related protein [Rhodothermales bacterium]
MSYVETERSGAVATLTLNHPEKRNPLSGPMVAALTASFSELRDDGDIRVIVLTGKGSAFSAGADLSELDAMQTAPMGDHVRSSYALAALFSAMRMHPKPIIARVNGHAIAGGCGLALACDFAIAADHAKVGFTEVRIGFVPAIVSALLRTSMLDRRMRDLLLTGRLVEADEAVRLGLLSKAVDPHELDTAVEVLAETIIRETSATAVAMTKRLLASIDGMPQANAFRFLSAHNALARATEDCREGIAAFLEKREPPWKKGESV